MKKVLMAGLAFTLLVGCEQPHQENSKASVVGEHKVQSVVFNNQPIYFADGTGFNLSGEVLQETFTKVPDVQKKFRYQEGVRRAVRVQFKENTEVVLKSISNAMTEGGYVANENRQKEGLIVINFVKKGYPSVNVRFTNQTTSSGEKRTQSVFNWII